VSDKTSRRLNDFQARGQSSFLVSSFKELNGFISTG